MNTETLRVVLGYGYAFFVTATAFWFLFATLLDVNTATVPDEQLTVVVTASFGLINLAAGAVIQSIASAQASKAAERSQQVGANAALATPPSVVAPPSEETAPTETGGRG